MARKKEIIKEKVVREDREPDESVDKRIVTKEEVPIVTEQEKEGAALRKTYLAVYYIFGIIDLLLIFRFALKLLGANPQSGFVSLIYGLSAPFEFPFRNIFPTITAPGIETTSIFESSTLIAIFVYPIIAWGIAKIIEISTVGKPPPEEPGM